MEGENKNEAVGEISPAANDVILRCTTSDEKQVEVPCKLCMLTNLSVMRISHFINHLAGNMEQGGVIDIPVQLESRVFAKVIEWCRAHEGQPDPVVKEDPMTREREWFKLTEEENKFLKVSIDELMELMNAANLLDIRSLYLYSCQVFAGYLKGKCPQEIRDMLGIEMDLTDEEEEEIRRQNVWCNY